MGFYGFVENLRFTVSIFGFYARSIGFCWTTCFYALWFFFSKHKKSTFIWDFMALPLFLLNFYITRLFCTFFFNALNKCGVFVDTLGARIFIINTHYAHMKSHHTPVVYYAPVYPKWSPPLKRIIVAFYGHTCNSHIIATVTTTH